MDLCEPQLEKNREMDFCEPKLDPCFIVPVLYEKAFDFDYSIFKI